MCGQAGGINRTCFNEIWTFKGGVWEWEWACGGVIICFDGLLDLIGKTFGSDVF